MSEWRTPEQRLVINMPLKQGKVKCFKPTKIEMFAAYQFRHNFNRAERNFHPIPPINRGARHDWDLEMFRLKIDGRWHRPGSAKYEFLTLDEILKVVHG